MSVSFSFIERFALTLRDNPVEQRKHSRMTSGVINTHERSGMDNRGENIVPKFVSGIKVMGELVSRRDYCTQRTAQVTLATRQHHSCPEQDDADTNAVHRQ